MKLNEHWQYLLSSLSIRISICMYVCMYVVCEFLKTILNYIYKIIFHIICRTSKEKYTYRQTCNSPIWVLDSSIVFGTRYILQVITKMHQDSLNFLHGLVKMLSTSICLHVHKKRNELYITYLQLDYHKPTLLARILHLLLQVLKLKYITIDIVPFFRLGCVAYIWTCCITSLSWK